jgi:hypothetical protein
MKDPFTSAMPNSLLSCEESQSAIYLPPTKLLPCRIYQPIP